MRDRTSWPVVGVPINAPIESLPIGGWRSLAARTVRDREAPGSNPGPPTKIRIRFRHHGQSRKGAGSQPDHNFLESFAAQGSSSAP